MTTSAPIVDCRTDAAAGGHSPASRGSALRAKARARYRRWLGKHKQQHAEEGRAYRIANPEKWRAKTNRWRARNRRKVCKLQNGYAYAKNVRSQKTATMTGQLWGDVEDAWLWEHKDQMTNMELAKQLGRTFRSVTHRKKLLRAQNDQAQRPRTKGAGPATEA